MKIRKYSRMQYSICIKYDNKTKMLMNELLATAVKIDEVVKTKPADLL